MNQLKYFEGKICTLLTRETNRNFKEEAVAMKKPGLYPINLFDHFMGRVIHADVSCIILEHPVIKTRSYFRTEHVIGIIEEQELPKTPENTKLIEDLKKDRGGHSKTLCPNGHSLNVPLDIPANSEVTCPVCKAEWIIGEEKPAPNNDSELVDIDMLDKLAQEAKKL